MKEQTAVVVAASSNYYYYCSSAFYQCRRVALGGVAAVDDIGV
jgi:hypothetical protein